MTQKHFLKRPLILAFGSLLLLLAVHRAAYSQTPATADRRAPVEVPLSLKEPLEITMDSASPQESDQHGVPFPFPSLHGFFMLGRHNVMLYHSSAFESTNHPYQMIIKANITAPVPAGFYRAYYYDNIDNGWMWITHNAVWDRNNDITSSQLFTLPHLHAGAVAGFSGSISALARNGSGYWNNNHYYLAGATFAIERVMYFRRFDSSADYPETLTYLLFGIGSEDVYMAHYLTKRSETPGGAINALAFDDVVRVNRPAWLAGRDDLLESVIEVKIPSISVNTLPTASPLPLNSPINVTVYGNSSLDGENLTVEVAELIWFDTSVINEQ